jgi:hypothetical protein
VEAAAGGEHLEENLTTRGRHSAARGSVKKKTSAHTRSRSISSTEKPFGS